jgi:hypothetical protein
MLTFIRHSYQGLGAPVRQKMRNPTFLNSILVVDASCDLINSTRMFVMKPTDVHIWARQKANSRHTSNIVDPGLMLKLRTLTSRPPGVNRTRTHQDLFRHHQRHSHIHHLLKHKHLFRAQNQNRSLTWLSSPMQTLLIQKLDQQLLNSTSYRVST